MPQKKIKTAEDTVINNLNDESVEKTLSNGQIGVDTTGENNVVSAKEDETESTESETNLDVESPEISNELEEDTNSEENTIKEEVDYDSLSITEIINKVKEIAKQEREILLSQKDSEIETLKQEIEKVQLSQMDEAARKQYEEKKVIDKETKEKQELINRVKELESEKIKNKNAMYIADLKVKKPFLAEQITKMKISNQNEYELYLKPIESEFEELGKYRNYNKNGNANAFNGYNLGGSQSQASRIKKEEVIDNFLDGIIRK